MSVKQLARFLERYEQSSGQKVNKVKSALFVSSKLPVSRRAAICGALGFEIKEFPVVYLGCPLAKGRVRKIHYEFLIIKLRKRVEGWFGKMLSFAGRIVLARHVLNSMPIHCLSCSYVPKGTLDDLNRVMESFIWGSHDGVKRRHWLSLDKLAKLFAEGGLGLRNFKMLSAAYCIQHCWNFISGSSLWASLMRSKYCLDRHYLSYYKPLGSSKLWVNMLEWMPLVLENFRSLIGNGSTVDF